jgi:hypothetical protein
VNRGNRLFFMGAALIVMGVVGAYLWLLAGSQAAPPVLIPPPASQAVEGARLTSASGDVEMRLENGEWRRVEPGAEVAKGASLRTLRDAKAAVAYGNDLQVELQGESEVRLAEVNAEFTKFVVGEGLLFADVKGGKRRVLFATQDGGATAEAKDGALFLAADNKGQLRAAVTRGEAALESNGQRVTVGAGFVSVASAGKAPSAPVAVPASLLLKVRWPSDTTTAKRRQLVTGTATPGTRVRIGETSVWADADGRFQVIVDLREGGNRIPVQAVDVVGHVGRETSPVIELDTKAASPEVQTSPEMWKRKTP